MKIKTIDIFNANGIDDSIINIEAKPVLVISGGPLIKVLKTVLGLDNDKLKITKTGQSCCAWVRVSISGEPELMEDKGFMIQHMLLSENGSLNYEIDLFDSAGHRAPETMRTINKQIKPRLNVVLAESTGPLSFTRLKELYDSMIESDAQMILNTPNPDDADIWYKNGRYRQD